MRDTQDSLALVSVRDTAAETPSRCPSLRLTSRDMEPPARHAHEPPLPGLPELRTGHPLGQHAPLTRAVVVRNPNGLHLRVCLALVEIVRRHDAQVTIQKDGQTEDAASVLGLLTLAAIPGTELSLSATGPEAQAALEAVAMLVASDQCAS